VAPFHDSLDIARLDPVLAEHALARVVGDAQVQGLIVLVSANGKRQGGPARD
jgi:hypothetical protein